MSTPTFTNPAEMSSVTRLNALSAVCLDTETTGLDVATARLIQVGAVSLRKGKLARALSFETLVNPGIPIPPATTKIHGLVDADVATAPAFAQVSEGLQQWVGPCIVIGYCIGFDLAILKRESQLAGLPWQPPRTIDVQYMVKILAPQLPDYSLDTIASWLGVDMAARHRALGDAIITANVFLALVPRLLKRGIRTVAELEAACRVVNDQTLMTAQAGWYDFLHAKQQPEVAAPGLARIDSYPYRHRVGAVMTTPPQIVTADTPLTQVLSRLMTKRISSVFVQPAAADAAYGIVTGSDILRTLDKNPQHGLALPVGEVAQWPLQTVPQAAFLYRAIGRMARSRYRHLGVNDEQGRLVGALSARDLLKQRADAALNLGDAIDQAESGEDLSAVWAQLALVATALDREDVDVRDIAAVISRELCALTRRACQIAEQEMAQQGQGPPPVAYAMMVLGSGGRGESLLAMDQDNAIVYADIDACKSTTAAATEQWLLRLSERVADLLNAAGVPYCQGGIMAKNPAWRMSVARWQQQVGTWIARTSPQDIMNSDIFFDAVAVHGARGLFEQISQYALQQGGQARSFLHCLATNAADVSVPLGAFGRFRLKQARMDVKMGGILPIFSAARVKAIRHGIHSRSTVARLQALQQAGHAPQHLTDNLLQAHQIILSAILKQQLYDLENGIPLSNNVAPQAMHAAARNNLRWALEQVNSVADLLEVPLQ